MSGENDRLFLRKQLPVGVHAWAETENTGGCWIGSTFGHLACSWPCTAPPNHSHPHHAPPNQQHTQTPPGNLAPYARVEAKGIPRRNGQKTSAKPLKSAPGWPVGPTSVVLRKIRPFAAKSGQIRPEAARSGQKRPDHTTKYRGCPARRIMPSTPYRVLREE
jgi:hypothetical protein